MQPETREAEDLANDARGEWLGKTLEELQAERTEDDESDESNDNEESDEAEDESDDTGNETEVNQ